MRSVLSVCAILLTAARLAAASPDPLETPASLHPSSATISAISLEWSHVRGASTYRIYSGPDSSSMQFIGETDFTSFRKSGLLPKTEYYFAVTAASGDVESARTSAVRVSTQSPVVEPPPEPPPVVEATSAPPPATSATATPSVAGSSSTAVVEAPAAATIATGMTPSTHASSPVDTTTHPPATGSSEPAATPDAMEWDGTKWVSVHAPPAEHPIAAAPEKKDEPKDVWVREATPPTPPPTDTPAPATATASESIASATPAPAAVTIPAPTPTPAPVAVAATAQVTASSSPAPINAATPPAPVEVAPPPVPVEPVAPVPPPVPVPARARANAHAAASVGPALRDCYAVQIEAATNRAGIERHRDALALAGVEGRVEEFVRGAVTYYRLRVGCYPTKEEAHARAATVIPTLRANQIGAHPLVFLNDQAVR